MYINPKDGSGVDQAANVLAKLQPGELRSVAIESLIQDPDNPGWNKKKSLRKDTQYEKIGEAFEMFNDTVIVPIVVAKHESKKNAYYLIDGHGRIAEASDRGMEEIDARVLEFLDPLQRIVLRESLNNGQTSFDPTVQLADVFLAAKKMNKDVRDAEDVEEILAVFPPTLRKAARRKLKLLRDWPAGIVKQLSADAVKLGGIAYNKIEELDPLAKLLKKKHGFGDEAYGKLVDLYKGGSAFAGGRSQETIRRAKRIIGELPASHKLVDQFVEAEIDLAQLEQKSRSIIEAAERQEDVIDHSELAQQIMAEMDELDLDSLDSKQRKAFVRKLRGMLEQIEIVEVVAV
jgi:hypothetical protein